MLLVMKLAVLHLSQYDTIFLVMQLSVAARKRETGVNPFYQPLPPPSFFWQGDAEPRCRRDGMDERTDLGFEYENADVWEEVG